MAYRVRQHFRASGWCKECGHVSNDLKFDRCKACRIAYMKNKAKKKKK